jgi:hypothetical protein
MITQADSQTSTEQDVPETLSFSGIVTFVDQALNKIGEKSLSKPQLAVLEASWLGQTYQKKSDETRLTKSYLQCDVAPLLWKTLSIAFGRKVDKKTFRNVVESLIYENSSQATSRPNGTVNIGKSPDIDGFVGRESVLQNLSYLISANRCILIVGPSGIGKSSLVAKLFAQQNIVGDFEYIVFKYCIGTPTDDVQDLQQLLGLQHPQDIIPFIRAHRCLVCFDEIDSLIRHYTDIEHNSVFLFTSREPIESIERLSLKGRSVKTLMIEGLSLTDSQALMKNYALHDIEAKALHSKYDGNPMYLHQASSMLSLFGDESTNTRELETSLLGNLYRENLNSIFSTQNLRIGEIERGVLAYLVKLSQDGPINIGCVTNQIVNSGQYKQADVRAAIKTLAGRSLITLNTSTNLPQISVPHTVQKYIRLNPNNLFPIIQAQNVL